MGITIQTYIQPQSTNSTNSNLLKHLNQSNYTTQCLPHSSRSTLPRTTRSLETTPPQPCPKHPSRRPTVVLLSLQFGSSYYDGCRRSSAAQRFGNLEALKRRQDEESMARRQSFHDAYGKPGFLGTLWNNFTRGPITPSQK